MCQEQKHRDGFPLCMLGNVTSICCRSKNAFRNTIRVSDGLDQDQDRLSDLGPNSLQRLSADVKRCTLTKKELTCQSQLQPTFFANIIGDIFLSFLVTIKVNLVLAEHI